MKSSQATPRTVPPLPLASLPLERPDSNLTAPPSLARDIERDFKSALDRVPGTPALRRSVVPSFADEAAFTIELSPPHPGAGPLHSTLGSAPGTTVAPSLNPMTANADMNNFAGPLVQDLPGAPQPAPNSSPSAPASPQQSSPVRQLFLVLSKESLLLAHRNIECLRATISPSPDLSVTVELRRDGSIVEARLHLDRGDPALLLPHWPQLQEALGLQNIRLAPLDCSRATSGDSANSSTPQAEEQEGCDALLLDSDPAPAEAEAAVLLEPGSAWQRWA